MKSWKVSEALFPCDLSEGAIALGREAVAAAEAAWGSRQLAELEAEDRLAIACERAPTSDPTTASLRKAFQVGLR